jgi:hypothetical protein
LVRTGDDIQYGMSRDGAHTQPGKLPSVDRPTRRRGNKS